MPDATPTRRILVADDEHGTRSVLARLFRRQGFEVLEATDGEEALQFAVTHPVDLVLADMQMPRMRGDELGRWVDQLNPDVPILFMTAYPGYETALSAIRCRAADYLEKPFQSLDYVVQAVGRALERRDEALRRRELAAKLEQSRRADDLRRRFLSVVAHELRTPLTVIKSFSTMLGRGVHGPLTPDQSEVVGHVLSESDRLAHEIDKLLSLARLENEDFEPQLETVCVDDVLRPVIHRARLRAEEQGVDLQVDVDCQDAVFRADPTDVPRALGALAENAVKFTGAGGRVTIRVRADAEFVAFEVEDTGIGIDPAEHGRIFDMFVQLESPLTRRHRGSGLGLTFADRIVRAHGSEIRVRSQLGDGATFAFRLPVAAEPVTRSMCVDLAALEVEGA